MIPVIFIHRGQSGNTLGTAVLQSKVNNRTILIGDTESSHANANEFYDLSVYTKTAKEFAKIYIPLSTLGEYELFCFLRWFILYDFMKDKKIDKCFYLDSDVMFYSDTETEAEKFKQFDLTLVHKSCGCSSYITLNGLNSLCKFMYELYFNKGFEYDKIASHFYILQKHKRNGGVCDMTLLEYYARYINAAGTGEMMYIIDNSTYDHCIDQTDRGYEMKDGKKNIVFINNKPHCKLIKTSQMIKFNTLHFQGGNKTWMPQYYKS